jgi:hypothetical protein
MVTLAEVAKRDGTTKGVVSRKVARLVKRHNLQVVRDGAGRVRLVDIDQYEALRARTRNPARAQAPRPGRASGKLPRAKTLDPEGYDAALVAKTWASARRSELKLQQERGELLRASDVAEAVAHCGQRIVRHLELPLREVDSLTTAATTGGSNGLHRALKQLVLRQRTAIAEDFAELAGGADSGQDGGDA